MMLAAVSSDIWRYQPHPEVWLLIGGLVALGFYATRVIGPTVVTDGPVVTRRQKRFFAGAVVLLWLASDWPMHDISEEYLYWVHMVQHMLFTLVIPPMLLLAMPEWLARLLVSRDGSSGVWLRRLAYPVVAGLAFNLLTAATHAPAVVNFSVDNGPFHYLVHTVVFLSALLMWVPVVGPLPELRISLPAQALYLFLMSIVPTVPGAWLTFADNAVYSAYDHPVRLWNMTVIADQQAAGMIMKLIGGLFLWSIIALRFFQWSNKPNHDRVMRKAGSPTLTYEQVAKAFEESQPATEPKR